MTIPVTVVFSTKNEELAIGRAVAAVSAFDEVIVVDSNSTDRTTEIAADRGAKVRNFTWDGRYPKKKQWCLENLAIRNEWLLFLDGDEVATHSFIRAVNEAVRKAPLDVVAFDIPLRYRFQGRSLRFGHVVSKRALIRPERVSFPEFPDLDAPGMGELEGHYQPTADGRVGVLSERLLHDDPDPLGHWVERHNRYADWEAYLAVNSGVRGAVRDSRSRQGRAFDRVPLKPVAFFFYSYVARFGFLDGRAGFDYAFALSWYYWLIDAKVREARRGHP